MLLSLSQEEGVTWDLLHEDESGAGIKGAPDVSEDDEEGEAWGAQKSTRDENAEESALQVDEKTEKAIRHKVLFVEEVMDNPRVRFFGLTRPGSYAAVSLEFNEVASASAVDTLYKWMKHKQLREGRNAEAGEREGTTIVAGVRQISNAWLFEPPAIRFLELFSKYIRPRKSPQLSR